MQIGIGPASSSTEFHAVDTGAYRYVYWSIQVCVLEHTGTCMCIGAYRHTGIGCVYDYCV